MNDLSNIQNIKLFTLLIYYYLLLMFLHWNPLFLKIFILFYTCLYRLAIFYMHFVIINYHQNIISQLIYLFIIIIIIIIVRFSHY
jgi:hypothetical protein